MDAILGRVLEAFAAAMMRALDDAWARRLVLRPDMGLIMGCEGDATLLGDPMAFYVPRSQDTFDGASFLAALKSPGVLDVWSWTGVGGRESRVWLVTLRGPPQIMPRARADKPYVAPGVHRLPLKVHGFGLEGDAATEEVLLAVLAERPPAADTIMAGQRTQVRQPVSMGDCLSRAGPGSKAATCMHHTR